MSQLSEEGVLCGWLRDDLWKVLVLIVVTVEHRELLLAVRRHVCRIDIERHAVRQFPVVLSLQLFDIKELSLAVADLSVAGFEMSSTDANL